MYAVVLIVILLLVAISVSNVEAGEKRGVSSGNPIELPSSSTVVVTPQSDYVPGQPAQASFDVLVTGEVLSKDGVQFTRIDLSQLVDYQLTSGEIFAYVISSSRSDGATVISYDLFHNADVAGYYATKEGQLNLFLVTGDESQAKANLSKWCKSDPRVCITSLP